MTEPEAQRLVLVLVTAYPGAMSKLTTDQQRDVHKIYRRMLVDLPYSTANAAVEKLLATYRPTQAAPMPTIADIRRETLISKHGNVRAGAEAWGDVLKTISRWGFYRPIEARVALAAKDTVAARCVDAFGWEELCNSECAHSDRARFIELYDQLAEQYRLEQNTAALPAAQRYRALKASEQPAALPERKNESRSLAELVGCVPTE